MDSAAGEPGQVGDSSGSAEAAGTGKPRASKPAGSAAAADLSHAASAGPAEPDYRFTLANERTFLAYVRTALALDAAGVAAMQFLTSVDSEWVRRLIGIVLTVAGIGASIGAYHRWRANVAAMRHDLALPPTLLPVGLAVATLVVSLAAIYLVAFG